jgi:hypothetical protein
MTKREQTVDLHLQTIEARCPELLNAMHHSREAVMNEIQVMESACRAFDEAYRTMPGKSRAAARLISRVSALRGQMARQGLMDSQELAAFRQDVLVIHKSVNTVRETLSQSSLR